VYSIIAFFVSNRRKSKISKRKTRYILVQFNRNFLKILKEIGLDYEKVQESDLPVILKKFDDDDALFEKASGVYEQLEKFNDLKSEIDFYQRLECMAIVWALLLLLITGALYMR
jgi:hypothetical protein